MTVDYIPGQGRRRKSDTAIIAVVIVFGLIGLLLLNRSRHHGTAPEMRPAPRHAEISGRMASATSEAMTDASSISRLRPSIASLHALSFFRDCIEFSVGEFQQCRGCTQKYSKTNKCANKRPTLSVCSNGNECPNVLHEMNRLTLGYNPVDGQVRP